MIINRDKFFKRVNLFHGITDDDCWEWTGKRDKDGYGKFSVKRDDGTWTRGTAHRVSWTLFKGNIPEGKWVLHTCDWPPCVNGSHLYLGNGVDNVRDMISRGRQKYNPVRKLTESEVLEIINAKDFYGINKFLSEKYGVSNSVISEIRSGIAWKHLQPKTP